ncbi:MAG TPA: hypothetical protein VK808_10485 [Bacteroidia bacterium]|jgi:hypothetical protein|nr:hypothetical protein [Bacteroidia bacterium]
MSDIVLNDFTYLDKYKEFVSRKEFWLAVSEQLSKDFNNDFSLKLDEETDLQGDHIAEIFVKELEKELPSYTPRLSEILYRIDVPEAQVASLKNVPDDIYYRCLSEMIMKRIILKVAIRKSYKPQ